MKLPFGHESLAGFANFSNAYVHSDAFQIDPCGTIRSCEFIAIVHWCTLDELHKKTKQDITWKGAKPYVVMY